MNMKTVMIALTAFVMGGAANAITSEEIANALGVDPNIATFSMAGDAEWTIDTNIFHSGTASMKSGKYTWSNSDFHGSDLIMTIDVKEACRLRYWFKMAVTDTSSSYEKLLHVIDNSTYTDGGNKDWVQSREHILTPGQHMVKWMHQRRYGTSGNSWIDDISLEPIMPTTSKVEVTNIKCQQRYPWNGMVDIDYTVRSEDPNAEVWVYPIGYDKDSNTSMAPRSLTGDGVDAPVSNGTFRMTWKVTDDYPGFNSTAFTVKMIALTGSAPYMVVDLSGGVDALSYPVSYLSSVPEGGWGDEYKTTKLVLRLIPPGSFMMGSPSDENGRNSSDESLHPVILTKPFYIGVFEITQKQYELVAGSIPSSKASSGDKHPVSGVSYTDIRGTVNGVGWPTHNQVDANSFMGRLRSKVNMLFDLPTEAQWEYACRAGTSSALNNGKSITSTSGTCANLDEVAWYYNNAGSPRVVGQKICNSWGLYDMHGNVNEWCRDYWASNLGAVGVIDPKGASSASSSYRVFRGGGYGSGADYNVLRRGYAQACRSASRGGQSQTTRENYGYCGFRVMCSPVSE